MENVQVPSTISITQIKQSSVTLCVTEYTNGKNFLTHQTKYKYIQTESPWTITQNSICSLAATGVQFNITEINVNEKEIYPAQIIKGSSLQSPKMYHPIKNKPTWILQTISSSQGQLMNNCNYSVCNINSLCHIHRFLWLEKASLGSS